LYEYVAAKQVHSQGNKMNIRKSTKAFTLLAIYLSKYFMATKYTYI